MLQTWYFTQWMGYIFLQKQYSLSVIWSNALFFSTRFGLQVNFLSHLTTHHHHHHHHYSESKVVPNVDAYFVACSLVRLPLSLSRCYFVRMQKYGITTTRKRRSSTHRKMLNERTRTPTTDSGCERLITMQLIYRTMCTNTCRRASV